jgi:hypothetical protein
MWDTVPLLLAMPVQVVRLVLDETVDRAESLVRSGPGMFIWAVKTLNI